jgi:hypothetical protein
LNRVNKLCHRPPIAKRMYPRMEPPIIEPMAHSLDRDPEQSSNIAALVQLEPREAMSALRADSFQTRISRHGFNLSYQATLQQHGCPS